MQNSERIKALKDAGYRVHVNHLRYISGEVGGGEVFQDELFPKYVLAANGLAPSSHGGQTRVWVDLDGETVARGVARCNPVDPFYRRLGLTIALNRLDLELVRFETGRRWHD